MENQLKKEKDYILENIKQYSEFNKSKGMSLSDNKKETLKAVNKLIERENIGSTRFVKDVIDHINKLYQPFEKGFQNKILKKLGLEEDSVIEKKFSKTFSSVFSDSFESLR